jgi:hypothetical protein
MDLGLKIIAGFLLNKAGALDVRTVVADETERLAIKYPYKGLIVKQLDTLQRFEYITTTPGDGGLPSNTGGDWLLIPSIFTGTTTPASGLGAIGDVYIDEDDSIFYVKVDATTWEAKFTTSGSSIFTGTGAPSNGTGANGDLYVSNVGSVYTKSGGAWAFQFSIAGANGISDVYATTSSTSLDMTTISDPVTITVDTDLNYTVGQECIVASRGVTTKYFTGTVKSYNVGTGALQLENITANGAAGAETDWDVNLNGVVGRQGKAFKHLEHDINLTDAKITAVEAGTWTPESPYNASVLNDTRTSLISPVELSGSMAGHSITYDGTTWYDNGRWLGFTGSTGPQGPGYNATELWIADVTGNTYKLKGINGAPDQYFVAPAGPIGYMPVEVITIPTLVTTQLVENLVKKHYIMELPANKNMQLRGGCDVGTIVTVARAVTSTNNPPNNGEFGTSYIGSGLKAQLIYKGRKYASQSTVQIGNSCRSITFMAVSKSVGGVNLWVTIGEDSI